MAKWYDELNPELSQFIMAQHVFFTGTAAADGRVNVSPKGLDSFRIMAPNRVAYLDLTGSGNETAALLRRNPRITIMFCSFSKMARILRIYGKGRVILPQFPNWEEVHSHFPSMLGERQIVEISVEQVMTSCGYAVPRMEFVKERETLNRYWQTHDVEDYKVKTNLISIDGFPTGIFDPAPATAENGHHDAALASSPK